MVSREQLPKVSPPYGEYVVEGLPHILTRWAQAQGDSWIGKRLAHLFRKLVLKNRRKIIDGDLWGLKVRWHPLDNVTDRHAYFLPESWDVPERNFQNQHLPVDGVYLDIGANSGLYSLLALRQLGERGTLIALEPNPVMFTRLLENVALNPCRARIRLIACGVAESAGEVTLSIPAGNLGAASLVDHSEGGESVTVFCRPLYDIVCEAGVESIDFMKIDIEGYEAQALNPFFDQAPQSLWPRFINIETPLGIDWEGLGYRLVQRTRQNTLLALDSA